MSKHRLLTGGYARQEAKVGTVIYKAGDVVEGLSAATVKRLAKKGMLAEVSDTQPELFAETETGPGLEPPDAPDPTPEAPEPEPPSVDIGEQASARAADVRNAIDGSDSAAYVQAVLDAEKAGKGRVTIIDAATDKLAELAG